MAGDTNWENETLAERKARLESLKSLGLTRTGGGDRVGIPEPGEKIPGEKGRKVAKVQRGKRWTELHRMVKDGETTWKQIAEALDPEELARGQFKDRRGGFSGRPPAMVPKAFYDACISELINRGQVLYKENYLTAINVMTTLANDPTVKPADRMKAAQFVIERLEGKTPERVIITNGDDPFSQLMSGAVAQVSEDAAIANAQEYLARRSGADENA